MREEFTSLLRAQPFVPFVFETVDKETYQVPNVELLSVSKNGVILVLPDGMFRIFPFTAILSINGRGLEVVI
jgi:hypothetical protein